MTDETGMQIVDYVKDCVLTKSRPRSCDCDDQPCGRHDRDYQIMKELVGAYESLNRLYHATYKDWQDSTAQVLEAVAGLEKYGEHPVLHNGQDAQCRGVTSKGCGCGLDALLSRLRGRG